MSFVWIILLWPLALCVQGFTSFKPHAPRLSVKFRQSATSLETQDDSIASLLQKAGADSDSLSVRKLFDVLVHNRHFKDDYWQKKPMYLSAALPNIIGSLTMEDVRNAVDKDFLEAGKGSYQQGRGGWSMEPVSKPRGKSYEEAKLRFEDIQVAMKQTAGTVVFNSAGGFIPALAGVCLETVNAFRLPVAMNVYLTNPGQELSAPPHTDKQDVVVLQTQGQKRWRVFAPPPPSVMPRSDPFARGKGADILSLHELKEPLLDIVLSPGQMLYVPGGFPHTTDTLHKVDITSEASVHMTIGIDTHIWGLTYAGLRSQCLMRAGMADKHPLTKTNTETYWDLQTVLPLGFIADDFIEKTKIAGLSLRGELEKEITHKLLKLIRQAESSRFPDTIDDESLSKQLHTGEVIQKALMHYTRVVDIFGRMYYDIANEISPAKLNLSFFRSQPYFQELESTMAEYVSWPEKEAKAQQRSSSLGVKDSPNRNQAASKSANTKGFGAK